MLHPTKNDLPESVRQTSIEALNRNLADAIHFSLQSKQAHWNVKGSNFIALHELFDQAYEEASGWVDSLAERAVQLGGVAEGTLSSVADKTSLPAYALDVTAGAAHVDALSTSLAVLGKSVREASDITGDAGDADTSDLFTEVSRGIDKMLWFLEAHLQND